MLTAKHFRGPAVAELLLVLVQQLTHLINRERRILTIQRFLTLTFFTKLMLIGEVSTGNHLDRIIRVMNIANG